MIRRFLLILIIPLLSLAPILVFALPKPSTNLLVEKVFESTPKDDEKNQPATLQWFVFQKNPILFYQSLEKHVYFPEKQPKLPPWFDRWLQPRECCVSQDGKRYVYEEDNESGSSEITIADFAPNNHWNYNSRSMDGYDDRRLSGCSLSADGNYLALTARYGANGLEVLDLTTRCKNFCPLWKKPWKEPMLGYVLGADGKQVIAITPAGAHFFEAKTGKKENFYSYSTSIQADLRNSIKTVEGKKFNIHREVILDPTGHHFAMTESCEQEKCLMGMNILEIREIKTGQLQYTFSNLQSKISSIQFSWDGRYLAVSQENGSVFVVKLAHP